MFLSGVLFVLFLAGCWLYCLTDAALTPAVQFRGLSKPTWITLIGATFILGAAAWLIARHLSRRARALNLFLAADAVARHPATRAREADPRYRPFAVGPDDDPEFLQMLAERIRDGY
jgi:hypothetical protein